jgi:hypothetical protein
MHEQADSALQRTPPEIWWMIFDEAIDADIPVMFATIYEGNHWPEDSGPLMTHEDRHGYERSEKQRKIIGSVCRSWQIFAQSRRNRLLSLNAIETDWTSEKRKAIRKARSVRIRPFLISHIIKTFPEREQAVDWEILSLFDIEAVFFAKNISHPRLRRLELLYQNFSEPPDMSNFINLLSVFPNLTWLSYHLQVSNIQPFIPVPEDRPPVVLPNLQVLWYRCDGNFAFPYSHVALPSLRYLSVHFSLTVVQVPLVSLLLAYSQTTHSVAIRTDSEREETAEARFPPWSEFPKLEELVLDKRWVIHFEELPPRHPLKRLEAQHQSFDTIPSFFDSMHMQTLVLQRVRWTDRGELEGRGGIWKIGAMQWEKLLQKAKTKGLRVLLMGS